jgi:hypothetical protein
MSSAGVRQLRQHVPLIKFPQRHGGAVQSLQDGAPPPPNQIYIQLNHMKMRLGTFVCSCRDRAIICALIMFMLFIYSY